jgi:hypothetical protein
MGSPADRRVAKTPQQYPAGGWMTEQRDDRVAVAIEACRPSEDGHHAIGLRQVEERLHIVVRQAVSHRSQPLLRSHLSTELSPPRPLVVRKRGRRQCIGRQR